VLAWPVISLSLMSLALQVARVEHVPKACMRRVQVVIMAASIAVVCHEAPAVHAHSDNDRWSRLLSQESARPISSSLPWAKSEACAMGRAGLRSQFAGKIRHFCRYTSGSRYSIWVSLWS